LRGREAVTRKAHNLEAPVQFGPPQLLEKTRARSSRLFLTSAREANISFQSSAHKIQIYESPHRLGNLGTSPLKRGRGRGDEEISLPQGGEAIEP